MPSALTNPDRCITWRHINRVLPQAPLILAVLLSRFEVELDGSMGGVEGMLERQCNTFTISIDKVRCFACRMRSLGTKAAPKRESKP